MVFLISVCWAYFERSVYNPVYYVQINGDLNFMKILQVYDTHSYAWYFTARKILTSEILIVSRECTFNVRSEHGSLHILIGNIPVEPAIIDLLNSDQ